MDEFYDFMKRVPVWPQGQKVEACGDPVIRTTRFEDIEQYHPRLIAHILELEREQHQGKQYFRGACGTKFYHPERWNLPEAGLLHARALALFRLVVEQKEAIADLSWANVYRRGDYCMPHSHLRSKASVVYFLENGDSDPGDPLSGRFSFSDPRLPACCSHEPGRMTKPLVPPCPAGTMLIFPSQVVHGVNPYAGTNPRITLSWNISEFRIPGVPLAERPT
jgi:hypothetical protein